MKFFASITALLAVAHLAGAGLVITEEVDQSGGPMPGKTDMTITTSGDKTRIDIGKELSSIVDSKVGTVTSLIHSQKIAMQLPEGMMNAVKEQVSKSTAKPDLQPTGKKETINGFRCEEYQGTLAGMKCAIWFTQDVKDGQAILDQLNKLAGSDPTFQAALQGGSLHGFPIRTVTNTPEKGKATMTVISISSENVPDSAFEVPADYKAMNMPQMLKPEGGAPAVPAGEGSGN